LTASADFLEYVWDGILSRDSQRIVNTFLSLDEQSRKTVLEHLQRMACESGWHPEQVRSAQSAIDAIKEGQHGSETINR
jgi:hypothetical protein